jgi:hypothetical protein
MRGSSGGGSPPRQSRSRRGIAAAARLPVGSREANGRSGQDCAEDGRHRRHVTRATREAPGLDAYGRSWDRLVALKRRFDPDNFFRLNQNVNPVG